jgi:hypothetical protein
MTMTIAEKPSGLESISFEEVTSMHARAEHWQSAFDFYRTELRFLRSLVNNHAIWINDDKQVQLFISCENHLVSLDRRLKRLLTLVSTQLVSLKQLATESTTFDVEQCREALYRIETLYTEFLKDLLAVKRNVFALTESANERKAKDNTSYL